MDKDSKTKTANETPQNEEVVATVEETENTAEEKPEKSLLDKISDKKDEAKAVDQATQELAEENNLPSENDADVVSKGEKFLSAIGYLSFLCILPLVLKPKSDFCQIHGKQGLILIILWLLVTPIRFLGGVVFNTNFFTGLFGFIYLVLICYGIFTVFQGKKEIPILSKVARKLNW